MKSMTAQYTDASHESITRNLGQNASTARTLRYEATMFPFRYAETHGQCCDSSTDLGERATYKFFAVIRHLRCGIELSESPVNNGASEKYSRFDLLMSLSILCIRANGGSDGLKCLIHTRNSDLKPRGD
jgi:hypothetical protein